MVKDSESRLYYIVKNKRLFSKGGEPRLYVVFETAYEIVSSRDG